MPERKTLEEVHTYWIEHCACSLRSQATQAVPGVGNTKSNIAFIGEAPGKDEDIQGAPFVGRAGKFLNEMLECIGLVRNDVYITNIVKFRPPNNRDPELTEIHACLPWLFEELQLLSPRLIIPLGRHALQQFFPEAKISEVHGKLLKRKIKTPKGIFPTEYFFPLYHPAAALYNGSMRDVLLSDFKKIPAVMEKIAL